MFLNTNTKFKKSNAILILKLAKYYDYCWVNYICTYIDIIIWHNSGRLILGLRF